MMSNDPTSLIVETLNKKKCPLLAAPDDAAYVYPVSSFPPLSEFEISFKCPALIVPSRRTAEYRKKLKSVLLNKPKVKVVFPLSESDEALNGEDRRNYRKLLLASRFDVYESEEIRELLETKECFKGNHELTQSYADWSTQEVLTRILPVDSGEVPSAFEQIGHLAHINLRSELIPFKYVIGKVLLDKNSPRIQTVVNKLGSIESEFRTFGMEVIAGNQDKGWSKVTVKEEGCQFTMDFRKVYWNSRLGGEHRRLTDIISEDAEQNAAPVVVGDFMAGIGPFAVPLSSKGYNIHVHANDLNPASYEYLVFNSRKNKCQNLTCYNMDARSFCYQLQDRDIDFHHVIMNLPASAPEFLDAFRGFKGKSLPRVHVHCFAPKDYIEAEKASIARCQVALGCKLDPEKHNVRFVDVRNVSPKKTMYCISFSLPAAVRDVPRINTRKSMIEPDAKRKKLN
jgi:tRNA (guanine37-N1)-methyltransferase